MEETIQKQITENPDSLEIGTPSKGGAIKIYFDSNNIEAAKTKIKNAKEIKEYAQANLSINT